MMIDARKPEVVERSISQFGKQACMSRVRGKPALTDGIEKRTKLGRRHDILIVAIVAFRYQFDSGQAVIAGAAADHSSRMAEPRSALITQDANI
jgi:hypothetical protein